MNSIQTESLSNVRNTYKLKFEEIKELILSRTKETSLRILRLLTKK